MMKRLGVLLGIVSIIVSLAACTNPAAPPGNYGSISGKITSTSGQPLAGANVVVDNGPSGTSAADGTYNIAYVPVTDALSPDTVSVTPPAGYAAPSPRTNVQVAAGKTTTGVDFTLSHL